MGDTRNRFDAGQHLAKVSDDRLRILGPRLWNRKSEGEDVVSANAKVDHIGATAFIVLRDVISAATPEYWEFWIGLALVIFVLAGRERIAAAPRRLVVLLAPRATRRGVA